MKQTILTVAVAILASLATFFVLNNETAHQQPIEKEQKAQSGYEYVAVTGTLRCAYATWPPYMMKDPNTGKLSGVAYDQMEQVAKFLEIKIDWTEEVGYGNYIEGLKTNRYDMMCATIWPDGSRTKNTTLTIPGLYSTTYTYVRIDESREFKSYEDINKDTVTIAALDGDVTYSLASNRFPKAKIHALPQTADGSTVLLAVATGKADVVIVDEGVFADFNKQNPGKLRKLENLGPAGVFSESYSVPLGDFQLKNMIDTALIYLTNSGITADILSRYKGSLYAPAPTYVNK